MKCLTVMTALQSLNLDKCYMLCNDDIFALSALVNLTKLSLENCGASRDSIGCWTLAALQHMPQLADLNLSMAHLKPLALLPLGQLTNLTQLNLAHCSNWCSADLQVISSLQRLRQLNLASSLTGDSTLTDAIMQLVLPLPQLMVLDLSHSAALTEAVVPQLCAMTNLQDLNVTNCPGISEVALDKLYATVTRLVRLVSNGAEGQMIPLRALDNYRLVLR